VRVYVDHTFQVLPVQHGDGEQDNQQWFEHVVMLNDNRAGIE
jgi:hypothetical protein